MQPADPEPAYVACLCLLEQPDRMAQVLCLCASRADVKEDAGRDGGTFTNAGTEAASAAANTEHIPSQPADTRLQVSILILAPLGSMIAAFQCALDQLLQGRISHFRQFCLACSGRELGRSSATGHDRSYRSAK